MNAESFDHQIEERLEFPNTDRVEKRQELLNVEELAAWLKVSKTWVYDRTRLAGPETIPHFRMGKYLRFAPQSESFQRWFKTLEVPISPSLEPAD